MRCARALACAYDAAAAVVESSRGRLSSRCVGGGRPLRRPSAIVGALPATPHRGCAVIDCARCPATRHPAAAAAVLVAVLGARVAATGRDGRACRHRYHPATRPLGRLSSYDPEPFVGRMTADRAPHATGRHPQMATPVFRRDLQVSPLSPLFPPLPPLFTPYHRDAESRSLAPSPSTRRSRLTLGPPRKPADRLWSIRLVSEF